MSSLKKFSIRDLIFYGLAIFVLGIAISTVQRMDSAEQPVYSQIRLLFEQEKVRYFQVEDDVLTM